MNEMRVFVGNHAASPVQNHEPPQTLHPCDFEEYQRGLAVDCFTNNPYWVDCYKHHQVVLVGDDGALRTFSQHPDFEQWKSEFTAGEIWSVFGDGPWATGCCP